METHEKALELKRRIARIDGILALLNKIVAKGKKDTCASINETGFVAHPDSVLLDTFEVSVLVKALENERANLEREFEAL
ncbi:MAG: hypothetical protein II278_08810 [Bacteroidaceae bacterium]|nr:hypothetical protein [Bacteroidaceae bacterium]